MLGKRWCRCEGGLVGAAGVAPLGGKKALNPEAVIGAEKKSNFESTKKYQMQIFFYRVNPKNWWLQVKDLYLNWNLY